MTEIDSLLKEADKLGILNIDVNDGQLTPEIIKIAIEETKLLESALDKEVIKKKLQKVDKIVARQKR